VIAGRIPIGIIFAQTEIGTDFGGIRDYAQAAERLGFSDILAYDHVIGADLTNRPDWNMPYHLDTMFHEPLVLLSHVAAVTETIGLMTGVIILPQRQEVLFAKQAATLDLACNGRLRLGIGLGWNKVEYDALGRSMERRGACLEDQVWLLRRLWTERSFSDRGSTYDIVEAGIFPLPEQQPIPLLIGGFSKAAMNRAARIGDGWLPLIMADKAPQTVDSFREAVEKAGRDQSSVKLENLIHCFDYFDRRRRTFDSIANDVAIWEKEGVDALYIDTMNLGARGAAGHIKLMEDLSDVLGLQKKS